jgi:chromosome segregation ATPase
VGQKEKKDMAETIVTPEGTPIESNTTEKPGNLDPAAMQAFLEKRGLKDIGQLESVLEGYKTDIGKFKNENKDLSGIKSEYEKLKAEAEQRRQAELTETQKLQELNEKKEQQLNDLQGKIKQMEKAQLKDRVLFEHGKDKPLLGTRMKLYDIASKTAAWETAEELKEVFAGVDAEFDSELQALNIQLPAPGDGKGGSGNGGSGGKYDQNYFNSLLNGKKT